MKHSRKNLFYFLLVSLTCFSIAAHAKDDEAKLCKRAFDTKALMKSRHNNGTKSNGVIFSNITKLSDGMLDGAHDGLRFSDGKVSHKDETDFFSANPNKREEEFFFFSRDNSGDYPDKNTHGGSKLVEVDNPDSGVICPEEDAEYRPHYTKDPLRKNDLFCVRAVDGVKFAVVQVAAVCKDGVVVKWKYEPSGSRVFAPDSASTVNQSPKRIER